ncbi:hypothetical protein PICMEDRAFT_111250 [Pichia membranifaciens NRRL Y-2026]|uniref:Uncharacterized protein n=1 Tax=Pichia membranifaciens NRRL Y-2026 TaxID=763406 RepID=A0A1E3NMH5_9ASCO|nr:hypothetical protein PICMEDRAFT_111250 [Pichia membranifaciens NRRL Y-2026]ODQ47325.1 hypothetical protein PICMEDRAFT_111250 [Pichia membranifaciens NRRL Y-2026]
MQPAQAGRCAFSARRWICVARCTSRVLLCRRIGCGAAFVADTACAIMARLSEAGPLERPRCSPDRVYAPNGKIGCSSNDRNNAARGSSRRKT